MVLAVVLVVVVATALIVVVPRLKPGTSSGTKTYADNGVSLSYPSGWGHGPSILATETASSLWSETFAPAGGPDGVLVTQYRLDTEVSDLPATVLEARLKTTVSGLAQGAGGRLTSEVTPTTVGTVPGYQVAFTASLEGKPYTVELTMLFVGLDQYNINCQYSDATSQQIKVGCEQVKDTFRVTGSTASP